MNAHKVPATYYDSWNIPGMKHSFYYFYASDLYEECQTKSYREVRKITTEHTFFMEEDFYYLDIEKIPGLVYKLRNEIEQFFREHTYTISFPENDSPDHPDIMITDYDSFMHYRDSMNLWTITDTNGTNISIDVFKKDMNTYLFDKIGKIIEVSYFAHKLEPKWNTIKAEIEVSRNYGDDFSLMNINDFLEFFVIQYLRLNDMITGCIEPTTNNFSTIFASMGFSDIELKKLKEDGLLAPESYFYGILFDIAKGNTQKLDKFITSIKENYVIDLYKATPSSSFFTSTSPCIVTKMDGIFKSEMIFPVTPQYCIRFVSKTDVGNRTGKFFEISIEEVKNINRQIIASSRNIVISESKNILDKI